MRSIHVGEGDEALDQRLSTELGLAAGISGWTWGVAAGIGMTWVRDDQRAGATSRSRVRTTCTCARSSGHLPVRLRP